MRKSVIAMLAVGLCSGVSQAAIAPASTGNGELFLNVVDEIAQVSYLLDMGTVMNDFFQSAQDNGGYQRFWLLDSPVWSNFLSQSSPPNLRWSVMAVDGNGGLALGAQRLFTTVRQRNETWRTLTNANFSTTIGTPFLNFLGGNNGLPSHQPQSDYSVNGESVSRVSDPNFVYYGSAGAGLRPVYLNTTLDATNQVGQSSWFYYLTRSGTNQNATVIADEFDNGNPTDGGNDGYWGFVKVNNTDPALPFYDPTSPFAGKYVLSFTLAAFSPVTTLAVREFAAGIGRTEYSGGFWVESLAGAAAASSEGAAGWVRTLGAAGGDAAGIPLLMTTPVPEPGRVALTLLGLAAVGGVAARRRQQAKTLGGN